MAKNDLNPTLRNVMLTGFSSLGNVAMTIPIVYPVCLANPNVSFTLTTRKGNENLFVNKPANLTVVGIEMTKYRTFAGAFKLAKNLLMRYNFDAVADLQGSAYTWCIDKYFRYKKVTVVTVDRCRKYCRKLTSGKIRNAITPIQERMRDVMSNIGLDTGDEFVSIINYGEPINSKIVPEKGEEEKWIAIAPFTEHKGKAYPIEQMQMIIAELARWDNIHIFLFGGGKNERAILDPIMRRHKNVTSVPHIDDRTFADEYELMRHCDVMLTLDSANMHLASLVETPVVSVWGATHPWCGEMGWHQALKDTVQLDLDCRPCSMTGNKRCRFGDYHCLHDISPEMIIKKVKRVLERADEELSNQEDEETKGQDIKSDE
ncbi:MAG: glycosyltransferase family 9 protein [Muribaculaceae bacterium]|nr:glycosyltransferase family 9 protein [Muribaculaceae bacterium]